MYIRTLVNSLGHEHGYVARHYHYDRIDAVGNYLAAIWFTVGMLSHNGIDQGPYQKFVGRVAQDTTRAVVGMLQDKLQTADIPGAEYRRMDVYVVEAYVHEICRSVYLEGVHIARRHYEQMAVMVWETVAVDPLQSRPRKDIGQFEKRMIVLLEQRFVVAVKPYLERPVQIFPSHTQR